MIVALALLGSVFLSATANGIVTFMLFGAGLVAGLMQSIADAIGSHSLGQIAHAIAVALPFEALYQAGLHALTANQTGFTGALIQLGPFGSSHAGGPGLDLWAAAYVALALRDRRVGLRAAGPVAAGARRSGGDGVEHRARRAGGRARRAGRRSSPRRGTRGRA